MGGIGTQILHKNSEATNSNSNFDWLYRTISHSLVLINLMGNQFLSGWINNNSDGVIHNRTIF